jgi:hypothetical protein
VKQRNTEATETTREREAEMSKISRITAVALIAVCLVITTATPVSAGIIGSDNAICSESKSLSTDGTVYLVAYNFSPRLANLLLRMGFLR